jgi:hypothetical protein
MAHAQEMALKNKLLMFEVENDCALQLTSIPIRTTKCPRLAAFNKSTVRLFVRRRAVSLLRGRARFCAQCRRAGGERRMTSVEETAAMGWDSSANEGRGMHGVWKHGPGGDVITLLILTRMVEGSNPRPRDIALFSDLGKNLG